MNSAAETILQHGKYRIDSILGRGEFGITYRATHLHIGQTVAIKTLARHPGQQQDISKLRHQSIAIAQRWSLCQHPNLVRVLDLFEERGYPFIVMQFVPGQTLQTLVQPGNPLPAPQAVHCIRQIASALQVAHRQGLLHCNLRPTSIIRRTGSRLAMLADFGASSFLQPDAANRYIPSGGLGGGYAALEQYLPHETPTPGTDIYRLSATLYYLLTGEPPLEAPLYASQLTEQLLRTEKPNLRQFQRDLNPAVEEALRWGLELQPQQRPSSIADWLEVLPTPERTPAAPPPVATGHPENRETAAPPPAPVPTVRERHSPKPPPPKLKRGNKSRLWMAPLFILTAFISGWMGFEVTRRYGDGIAGQFDPGSNSRDEPERLVLDPSKPIFEDPDLAGQPTDFEFDGDGEPQLLGDGSTDVGELLEDVAYEETETFPDPYNSPRAIEAPDYYASETPPEPSESTAPHSADWDDYYSDPESPPSRDYPSPEIPEETLQYSQPLDPVVPDVPDVPESYPDSDLEIPEPPASSSWERELLEPQPERPVSEPPESWLPEEPRSRGPSPEADVKKWDEFPPQDPPEPNLELSGAVDELEHL